MTHTTTAPKLCKVGIFALAYPLSPQLKKDIMAGVYTQRRLRGRGLIQTRKPVT